MAETSAAAEEAADKEPEALSAARTGVERSLPRSNTMPGETSNDERSEASTSRQNIVRSKTERRKQSVRGDPAAQIFDDKISDKKKIKMLNRIATVKGDGTVVFEVPSSVGTEEFDPGSEDVGNEAVDEDTVDMTDIQYMPPLQIVMLIVGTRGDVQPFIAIGKQLQDYGHRVRLATHANFQEFVLTAGLEFYPLGGDPKVLAECEILNLYMVKNKGFLPSAPSEIPIQRKQIKEIIYSLLPACKDPDDTGVSFKADAIIANPPAYVQLLTWANACLGHTHVAEALKVPIHIFFTMPWTPTSQFPHPLSRVKQPAGYRVLLSEIKRAAIGAALASRLFEEGRRLMCVAWEKGRDYGVDVAWREAARVMEECLVETESRWMGVLAEIERKKAAMRDENAWLMRDLRELAEENIKVPAVAGSQSGNVHDARDDVFDNGNLQCHCQKRGRGADGLLSYQIVDSMIWLGIRDMINDFRKKKLKLRPVTYLSGAQGSTSDVPTGYIWSPHLVPKPKDWGPKIDVVGFCFLDLASNYEPPESLMKWLEAGSKPIYIGFGSLPVQEPERMTQIIVDALEQTGQRGIINKGWGGLGNLAEPKDFVYLLDNCPHDWLFLQCAAVVHHGGAGTTAAGLKAACPTTIVPFFGDQPFWGEQVHARGVGPPPIPVEQFSLPKLIDAINFMQEPEVKERAVELATAMASEDGVAGAVKAFFKHLPPKVPKPPPSSAQSSLCQNLWDRCFRPVRKCFGCS
ncbi:hypothetical protein Taro_003615 [Colocasia esculenta]|uniref:Uncharacterized protein n=1 Tax=Colocasia esculenta TaxID=4460 RepID=A0A843TPG7_COLES|nr:hypothetical protein [Colocasia esculenta]